MPVRSFRHELATLAPTMRAPITAVPDPVARGRRLVWVRPTAVLLAGLFVGGCDDNATSDTDTRPDNLYSESTALVFNGHFEPVVHGDPFPAHRPADLACARASHSLEYDALELDTGTCNYFLLGAPTLTDIHRGDRITVRAFHEDLAALEPAVAHLAVAVGDTVIWDEEIPIPSPATPYTVEMVAEFDAPSGTAAVLHLHNHGINTYRVIDVRIQTRD